MSQAQRDIEQRIKMNKQNDAIKCFWRRLNKKRDYKIPLTEAAMIWCASRMAQEFEVNFRKGEV